MSTGFVYIMINPSFIKKVKIGITTRTSEERAKELSSTGVPDDFVVVYDELVNNCEEVEKQLHDKFDAFRTNKNREFFNIPVKEAIKELQKIKNSYLINEDKIEKVSIFKDLMDKYHKYL